GALNEKEEICPVFFLAVALKNGVAYKVLIDILLCICRSQKVSNLNGFSFFPNLLIQYNN
ncbi:MAG: hypothetical protein ACTSRS_20435, partial [Candidatus Helarchaeota archaeon]